MKKIFLGISLLLCAALCACAPREKVVIILSTNDIHAQIQNFPQLATAVAECRDTASVILVDAGDRWTGNAYVDQAEGRRPVLELMNELGYDVATLGNHEFDVGQQTLAEAIGYCRFPVICANMVSENSPIPQLKPYVILDREGTTTIRTATTPSSRGCVLRMPCGRSRSTNTCATVVRCWWR